MADPVADPAILYGTPQPLYQLCLLAFECKAWQAHLLGLLAQQAGPESRWLSWTGSARSHWPCLGPLHCA